MYSEDDLLPISGLQHLSFCERQWALIHIEQVWADNRLTAEGTVLHERVHGTESETRGEVRTARGLRLRSLRLGLTGQADVVEFHLKPNGKQTVYPVEYKRGKPKHTHCDQVQLCAQALCLEEMLDCRVSKGAFFYGMPRRRTEVIFDPALRVEVEDLALKMHHMFEEGLTPSATYEPKCDNCSLLEICQPKTLARHKPVAPYLRQLFSLGEDSGS